MELGQGFTIKNLTSGEDVDVSTLTKYIDNFHKDMIVVLPGQITQICAKFDKLGCYDWHCHILLHKDNKMMHVFHVGQLPVYRMEKQYLGSRIVTRADLQPTLNCDCKCFPCCTNYPC